MAWGSRMTWRFRPVLVLAAALPAVATGALPAGSQQGQSGATPTPAVSRWVTYEAGSMGHLQASALAQAIKARSGAPVVVLAQASDTARHNLLLTAKADIALSGLGSFFAQEGLHAYARPEFGPQDIRLVLGAWSNNVAFAATAGSGIRTLADLKGRRVGVVGSNAASLHVTQSLLDAAGLSFRDVKRIDLPGPGHAPEAVLMNKADAVIELTGSTAAHMIAGGPKGIQWLPVPHADEAIWKRLAAKAPYLVRRLDTSGAGLAGARSLEGAAYPYPIVVTRPAAPAETIRGLAMAMVDAAASLKGSVPGIEGYDVRLQRLDWVIPYHDGAIAWLKASGMWTEAAQTRNDRLIARQKLLRQAWSEARALVKADMAPAEVTRVWLFHRSRRLHENGFEAYF